jgi:FAD binding domain
MIRRPKLAPVWVFEDGHGDPSAVALKVMPTNGPSLTWTPSWSPVGDKERQRRGDDEWPDRRATGRGCRTAIALDLEASQEHEKVEGARFAAEHGLPVDLQATGRGAHRAMDGGLLIATRRLADVDVDAGRRVARVSAGATAADVIAATAPHGLAAPVGAAPGVGYVSYCGTSCPPSSRTPLRVMNLPSPKNWRS